MDQESSKQKKLDDLPGSESKFWDGEVIQIVPKKVPFFDLPHSFIRTTGREAQCTHCDWGFELDPGDEIRDGHLYDKSGKLII
jgi:hypothetical protein